MTLGPVSWCLLVGDVETQGPVTGGRHGWLFGEITARSQPFVVPAGYACTKNMGRPGIVA